MPAPRRRWKAPRQRASAPWASRARDDGETWRFLGILPLYDPPREDSRATIAAAREHGIDVKMVTGDNVAIAREISRQLGLGTNIQRRPTP